MLGTDQISGVLSNRELSLREIVAKLEETYCGTIGFEYMHIKNRNECNWIRNKIENGPPQPTREALLSSLERLMLADLFESYGRESATRSAHQAAMRAMLTR